MTVHESLRPWRCKCGATKSTVTVVEADEEERPIRIRTCSKCGAEFATEERYISLEAFFLRAESRRVRRRKLHRRTRVMCRRCKGRYDGGGYRAHTQTPEHRKVIERDRIERGRAALDRAAHAMYERRRRARLRAEREESAA